MPAARAHRRTPLVLLLLVLALLAAACGSEATSAPGPSTASATPEEGESDETAFPVTIAHKFGSTEIPDEPERVVSLGLTEQDAILALGVEPVAIRYAFGDESDVIFPWAEDAAGDLDPEILTMPFGELNFEAIAALEPDLIMCVTCGLTAQEYDTLAQIAPTVAQPGEYVDFGTPWQEHTRIAGRALGQEDPAEELVAEVETRFAEAREQHPEFDGASLVLSGVVFDGEYPFHASADTRTRLFTTLGFQVPEELDELAGDQFYGTISRERVDLFETDVVAWQAGSPAERESIESDPLLQQLGAVRDGRGIFLEGDVYDALQFSSVLSLPFLLDELVPQLAGALDGEAASR